MNTYKLYQVAMVDNIPICTYIATEEAADIVAAEALFLANLPANNVEYMIVIAK